MEQLMIQPGREAGTVPRPETVELGEFCPLCGGRLLLHRLPDRITRLTHGAPLLVVCQGECRTAGPAAQTQEMALEMFTFVAQRMPFLMRSRAFWRLS